MLAERRTRMPHRTAVLRHACRVLSLSLGGALMLGSAPADASQLVNLARLVITGQRLATERPAVTPVPRFEPSSVSATEEPRELPAAKLAGQSRGLIRAL
jgi:hypothetical protein